MDCESDCAQERNCERTHVKDGLGDCVREMDCEKARARERGGIVRGIAQERAREGLCARERGIVCEREGHCVCERGGEQQTRNINIRSRRGCPRVAQLPPFPSPHSLRRDGGFVTLRTVIFGTYPRGEIHEDGPIRCTYRGMWTNQIHVQRDRGCDVDQSEAHTAYSVWTNQNHGCPITV